MKLAILTAQIGHYHDARYRAVAAAGGEFTVLAVQNAANFREFMAAGDAAYPVERLYPGREAYRAACAEKRVWGDVQECLTRLDPAVVAVAGWATPESFAAIHWARRRERGVVMLSDSQQADASRQAWREALKARIVGLADAALVGGPPHRDYVTRLGIVPERVFMGYDAVDNAHFAAGADRAREKADAFRQEHHLPGRYLLASARFIPKKNIPRLVEACAGAIDAEDAPDLVILGDGPERPAVEQAIAASGVPDRIHLPGFRSYDLLPVFYGLADGFIHVSTSEQWGLVINEAAASGIPVIAASACGATGSLVRDGESGFVVEATDTPGIRAAITRLIGMPEARRRALGEVGRAIVADWGPERFASGLLGACEAALESPRRGLARWDAALLRHFSQRKLTRVA